MQEPRSRLAPPSKQGSSPSTVPALARLIGSTSPLAPGPTPGLAQASPLKPTPWPVSGPALPRSTVLLPLEEPLPGPTRSSPLELTSRPAPRPALPRALQPAPGPDRPSPTEPPASWPASGQALPWGAAPPPPAPGATQRSPAGPAPWPAPRPASPPGAPLPPAPRLVQLALRATHPPPARCKELAPSSTRRRKSDSELSRRPRPLRAGPALHLAQARQHRSRLQRAHTEPRANSARQGAPAAATSAHAARAARSPSPLRLVSARVSSCCRQSPT
mmetsp:Transcript_10241/g.32453  ORF Transcript_10241/g.32453 Transcript_10241/m.32453 type:complete len:275 (+) Transcript_10241:924-1748(+)